MFSGCGPHSDANDIPPPTRFSAWPESLAGPGPVATVDDAKLPLVLAAVVEELSPPPPPPPPAVPPPPRHSYKSLSLLLLLSMKDIESLCSPGSTVTLYALYWVSVVSLDFSEDSPLQGTSFINFKKRRGEAVFSGDLGSKDRLVLELDDMVQLRSHLGADEPGNRGDKSVKTMQKLNLETFAWNQKKFDWRVLSTREMKGWEKSIYIYIYIWRRNCRPPLA